MYPQYSSDTRSGYNGDVCLFPLPPVHGSLPQNIKIQDLQILASAFLAFSLP